MNPIEFLKRNGLNPDNYRTVPLQVGVACRDEYYNPKPVERAKVALPGVKAVAARCVNRRIIRFVKEYGQKEKGVATGGS